jgi:hypothetical protein
MAHFLSFASLLPQSLLVEFSHTSPYLFTLHHLYSPFLVHFTTAPHLTSDVRLISTPLYFLNPYSFITYIPLPTSSLCSTTFDTRLHTDFYTSLECISEKAALRLRDVFGYEDRFTSLSRYVAFIPFHVP